MEEDDTQATMSPSMRKLLGHGPSMPDFDTFLVSANDIDERTKSLWLEIYRNACHDRERANTFVSDIIRHITSGDPAGHQLHGPVVTKYLEKMAKANDQLLKLSELIQAYRAAADEPVDYDQLLDAIKK